MYGQKNSILIQEHAQNNEPFPLSNNIIASKISLRGFSFKIMSLWTIQEVQKTQYEVCE